MTVRIDQRRNGYTLIAKSLELDLMPQTLFEKIWDSHLVCEEEEGPTLLYVDRHLVHEVTSPQAFDGLRLSGRTVRRPDLTFATMDHNIPTEDRYLPIQDSISAEQMEALRRNCNEFGITLFDLLSSYQGIIHVIGPELGLTLPGQMIVCGDSHTSTHGAFGSLAFGIGTSEVEHVLATQCIWQRRPMNFAIEVTGKRQTGVTAKDVILSIIREIGTAGASGTVLEYRGESIRKMSMEERMTICNMSIEAGARAGIIAPDNTTFRYVSGRRFSPKGKDFDYMVDRCKELSSDPGARFDRIVTMDSSKITPQVTWGTNPGMVTDVTGTIPSPEDFSDAESMNAVKNALEYMNLQPGTLITEVKIDRVFIGSCTNARIEDLDAASRIIRGKRVAPGVSAMVVPGSKAVKVEAERRSLDLVFKEAGFEWRESGCSMCLGMNPDVLQPGERCASTSNRNFEGRQGRGGRTHLVSPLMAAAAAINGHFVDVREWI